MSKTFIYTVQSGPSYYSEQTDEDFYDEEEIEYEVDTEEIRSACAELSYDEFFSKEIIKIPEIRNNKDLQKKLRLVIEQGVKKLLSELDVEDNSEEYFDESLKDYFEEEAIDAWNNN